MVPEAPLERTENGFRPVGEGWFVLNVRDASWFESDGAAFYATFAHEEARFDQLGFGVGILRPVSRVPCITERMRRRTSCSESLA